MTWQMLDMDWLHYQRMVALRDLARSMSWW